MQNALQAALIAAKIKIIKPKPASIPIKPTPEPRQAGPRRVPYGTFDVPMKLAALDGLDRVSESKPPPPGFPRLKYFGGSDCPGESYFRGPEIED